MKSLPAKIAPPYLDQYIIRGTLFDCLHGAKPGSAMWLTASGGSGKTTLLSSYVKESKIPCVWYQVDERDSDPATLFHYLTLSLKLQGMDKQHDLPTFSAESMSSLESFAAHYFESFFMSLPQGSLLVLDNCQEAPEQNALMTVLRQAMKQLIPSCRMVILSRTHPWSEFTPFKMSQQLMLIEQEQLNFDEQDILALSKLLGCYDVVSTQIEQLREKTLGWAAGLTLLLNESSLLSQLDHPLVARNNAVFDYFAGELFSRCSDEARHFLLMTSQLPRISVDAAQELVGKDITPILTDLIKRNFFIVPYSEDKTVYQYHPLFRDFLLQRSEQLLSSEDFQHLLVKTADILLREDHITDAIRLLHQSEQWLRLAKVILNTAPALIGSGQFVTLKHWIERLPQDVIKESGWLLFWLGCSEIPLSPDQAIVHLKQAFFFFSAKQEKQAMVICWSTMADALVVRWRDFHEVDEIIQLYETHVGKEWLDNAPDLEARLISGMLGMLMMRGAERHVMDEWIASGEGLLPQLTDLNLITALATKLLYCHSIVTGDAKRGADLVQRFDSQIDGAGSVYLSHRIWWKLMVAIQFWGSHELQRMEQALSEALEVADKNAAHFMDTLIFCFFAVRHLACNDAGEAQQWIERQQNALDPESAIDRSMLNAVLGWQQRLLKNSAQSIQLGEASVVASRECSSEYNALFYGVLQCLNLFEAGRVSEAVVLLEKLQQDNQRYDCSPTRSQLLLLDTWFRLQQGDNQAAVQSVSGFFACHQSKVLNDASYIWSPHIAVEVCNFALECMPGNSVVIQYIKRYGLAAPDINASIHWPKLCRIVTLGRFEVMVEDQSLVSGSSRAKPWALLQIIIASGGVDVPDKTITDILWPDADGDAAQSAFSTTLMRLRKNLGRDDLVLNRNGLLSLNKQLVWLDCWALEEQLKHCAQSSRDQMVKNAEKLVQVYEGEFLPKQTLPWIEVYRHSIVNRLTRVMDRAVIQFKDEGDWSRVLRLCSQLHEVGLQSDDYQLLMDEARNQMGQK